MSAPTRPGDEGFVLDDSPIVIVPLIPEPPEAVFGSPEDDEEDRGDRQGGGA